MKFRIIAGMALSALPFPGVGMAQQAPDFGEIAGRLTFQLSPVSALLTVFAFAAGVTMAMIGLAKFRRASEFPSDTSSRPHVGLVFLFVGAAMVALPALISTGVLSIFGSGASVTDAQGTISAIGAPRGHSP